MPNQYKNLYLITPITDIAFNMQHLNFMLKLEYNLVDKLRKREWLAYIRNLVCPPPNLQNPSNQHSD